MGKYKAIPKGYMTVGEIAKKMNVTVRTLQYYDNEGLLPPSAESEGGLRLYTHKEIVKLHQIQSMKRLGFTLEEIKSWLPSQNTPEEVSNTLLEQANEIRSKINSLTDVLDSIEKLNTEVLQTQNVDWVKYASIFELLQAKSELYWAVKHFSDNTISHENINDINDEPIKSLIQEQNRLLKEADELQKNGVSPESEQGQIFARNFWNVIMELTDGDTSLLPEITNIGSNHGDINWKSKKDFIGNALNTYLEKTGNNPLKEESL